MSFPVRAPNNEIIILGKKLRKTQYLTKKPCTYRQTHRGTNRIKHYVEVTLPYLLARLFFKNLRNYNGDKKVKKVLFLGGTTLGGCCTTTTFCWGHFFCQNPLIWKNNRFFYPKLWSSPRPLPPAVLCTTHPKLPLFFNLVPYEPWILTSSLHIFIRDG